MLLIVWVMTLLFGVHDPIFQGSEGDSRYLDPPATIFWGCNNSHFQIGLVRVQVDVLAKPRKQLVSGRPGDCEAGLRTTGGLCAEAPA